MGVFFHCPDGACLVFYAPEPRAEVWSQAEPLLPAVPTRSMLRSDTRGNAGSSLSDMSKSIESEVWRARIGR